MNNSKPNSSRPEELTCHVCRQGTVTLVPDYSALPRVTSDCKPWPAGGHLGVCAACGCVQTLINAHWQDESGRIYGDYAMYTQASGQDQVIFDTCDGQAAGRSSRIVKEMMNHIATQTPGKLLDVGCGNGAFLRAWSSQVPGWTLFGADLTEKYRSDIERIPSVKAFYTSPVERLRDTFDIMVLIHSLEHIPHPAEFLSTMCHRLEVRGLLLVEVPDYTRNPFDLLVVDHCTHFTSNSLKALLAAAGYEVVLGSSDCVPKELTFLSSKADGTSGLPLPNGAQSIPIETINGHVQWLLSVIESAHTISQKRKPFGLLGTALAGSWLAGILGEAVDFFVDEDPQRTGHPYMGKPIMAPADVALDSSVFIPLPPAIAVNVHSRLSRPGVFYHLPPPH